MESYSFDMKPSYGFESEEKIDPDRKNAEMQYYSIYNQMTGQSGDDSVPKAQNQSDGFNDGFCAIPNRNFGNNLIFVEKFVVVKVGKTPSH